MKEMTKSQRRHLNELAGRAYECELSLAIDSVHQEIQKWKNKEMSRWEVDQKIHSYHDDEARSLYKTYVMLNDPRVAVAQAIAKGILESPGYPFARSHARCCDCLGRFYNFG